MSGLFLGTRLTRLDADGTPEEYDVTIQFAITHFIAGDPGRSYGEPGDCWPAEPAEYEFAITSIEHDPPDAALPPITDAERATLTAWFEAHHEQACEAADEATDADDDSDRGDYLYDLWKDEQMMKGLGA